MADDSRWPKDESRFPPYPRGRWYLIKEPFAPDFEAHVVAEVVDQGLARGIEESFMMIGEAVREDAVLTEPQRQAVEAWKHRDDASYWGDMERLGATSDAKEAGGLGLMHAWYAGAVEQLLSPDEAAEDPVDDEEAWLGDVDPEKAREDLARVRRRLGIPDDLDDRQASLMIRAASLASTKMAQARERGDDDGALRWDNLLGALANVVSLKPEVQP